MLAVLACSSAIASGAPGEGAPDQVGAGTLMFRSETAELDPAPRLSTEVDIAIAGVVARVSVAQQFHNAGTETLEGVYLFPLPDDAAVDRLTMRIGDRLIVGEIREREEAERIYENAKHAGRQAGLVAQVRPNLFTTSVANVAPGQRVEIAIEYLQTARYDDGELSLRFPMTLTPRYASQEGAPSVTRDTVQPGARDAAQPITRDAAHEASADAAPPFAAVRADADNHASIRVTLEPGIALAEVGSAHHDMRVVRAGEVYELELERDPVPMDRDFVVSWRPRVGAAPAVAAVTETVDGATYALLTILPPPDTHSYRTQSRELIFVVDTSGSMGGQSIEQARSALADALERLGGADRFNIFQFNSKTSSLYRTPAPLTPETRAQALDYVEGLSADGGTEMAPAIRAALAQPAARGYLRQVVFLTDGAVANETELFAAIKSHLGDARLFAIGIGAAPNGHFMRKAAQFGRGTYTHIGDAAVVRDEMRALFDKLSHVALSEVVADWPGAVEFFPHRVPDLYAGQPIVLAGRLEEPLSEPIAVRLFGQAGGSPWSQAVEVGPGAAPGVAALWARRKIEHVVDARIDGLSENLIRRLVVGVALEHGLVSPYTSLVAVDRTPVPAPGAVMGGRRTVANMVPAGAVVGQFPQTATAAPLHRWLGAALLMLAAMLGLRLRRVEFSR